MHTVSGAALWANTPPVVILGPRKLPIQVEMGDASELVAEPRGCPGGPHRITHTEVGAGRALSVVPIQERTAVGISDLYVKAICRKNSDRCG